MSNTHGLIIPGIVFIDGILDKCKHNWNGSSYFVTQSGKLIDWKTHRNWASYTDAYRSNLIMTHYAEIDDSIVESGVTCSKCNKPFTPEIF